MKAEQMAQRLFNTIRNQVARSDITTQLSVYQELVDEIEREMGRLEDEGSSEDEMFDTSNDDDQDDEV